MPISGVEAVVSEDVSRSVWRSETAMFDEESRFRSPSLTRRVGQVSLIEGAPGRTLKSHSLPCEGN